MHQQELRKYNTHMDWLLTVLDQTGLETKLDYRDCIDMNIRFRETVFL